MRISLSIFLISAECLMSDWTAWTPCSATCGSEVTETRTRLVQPIAWFRPLNCEGTRFVCKSGSRQCNEGGVRGAACSDGSPILYRGGSGSECDSDDGIRNRQIRPCRLSQCPQGKQYNANAMSFLSNAFSFQK